MSDKRVIDFDPISGTIQYHHYDSTTDTTTLETVENADPVLHQIQELRKTSNNAWKDAVRRDDGTGTYAATITPNMQFELLEYGLNLFSNNNFERVAAVKKAQELWPEAFLSNKRIFK